jgi:hypothetical protein
VIFKYNSIDVVLSKTDKRAKKPPQVALTQRTAEAPPQAALTQRTT